MFTLYVLLICFAVGWIPVLKVFICSFVAVDCREIGATMRNVLNDGWNDPRWYGVISLLIFTMSTDNLGDRGWHGVMFGVMFWWMG